MKSYVITLKNHKESNKMADRCIQSATNFNINVEKFIAIEPHDDLYENNIHKINQDNFHEKYSKKEYAISCFLSHMSLWERSLKNNETICILEHDAYFINNIPKSFDKVINIGKPSFGKFVTPKKHGINPLSSKQYFPGAHGYIVHPSGAKLLLEKCKEESEHTDVYMNLNRFPFLQEYYPWSVEARDEFSTVQKKEGCLAKHNYKEGYSHI